MIPLWAKCKDGSYVAFPYHLLTTFPDGKVGTLRSPFRHSEWLIFQQHSGRPLGEFFECKGDRPLGEFFEYNGDYEVNTDRAGPLWYVRWLLKDQPVAK